MTHSSYDRRRSHSEKDHYVQIHHFSIRIHSSVFPWSYSFLNKFKKSDFNSICTHLSSSQLGN
jgi:hypothetical protein